MAKQANNRKQAGGKQEGSSNNNADMNNLRRRSGGEEEGWWSIPMVAERVLAISGNVACTAVCKDVNACFSRIAPILLTAHYHGMAMARGNTRRDGVQERLARKHCHAACKRAYKRDPRSLLTPLEYLPLSDGARQTYLGFVLAFFAERGDEAKVEEVLARLGDAPDVDVMRRALQGAARSRRVGVARMLVTHTPSCATARSVLHTAAQAGCAAIMRLLMPHVFREYPWMRADNYTLVHQAIGSKSEEAVSLLFDWPEHAAVATAKLFERAGTLGSVGAMRAMIARVGEGMLEPRNACAAAAANGRWRAARFLLERGYCRADARAADGVLVIVRAAERGNAAVVRMLLTWPEHAPRADADDGEALLRAAAGGHVEVVRMLLEWPEHAPRADVQDGRALIVACGGMNHRVDVWDTYDSRMRAHDHHNDARREATVRLLLGWPEHAPRPDVQEWLALRIAVGGEDANIARELLVAYDAAAYKDVGAAADGGGSGAAAAVLAEARKLLGTRPRRSAS